MEPVVSSTSPAILGAAGMSSAIVLQAHIVVFFPSSK